jgi:hypothetical protein
MGGLKQLWANQQLHKAQVYYRTKGMSQVKTMVAEKTQVETKISGLHHV